MEKNNCHYEENIYYENKINDNEIKINDNEIKINDNEKVNQYIKTIIDKININNQIKLYEEFMYSF
jgi:hypothetical protein